MSIVYGMPLRDLSSTSSRLLSYSTFSNDFENAVLNAINGGGQNQARAILTGALVGAQVGLAGIPQRFLNGLENANELVRLAEALGQDAEREGQQPQRSLGCGRRRQSMLPPNTAKIHESARSRDYPRAAQIVLTAHFQGRFGRSTSSKGGECNHPIRARQM